MRAAHCQLGFVAVDAHTSLLLKKTKQKKQEKRDKLNSKIITS